MPTPETRLPVRNFACLLSRRADARLIDGQLLRTPARHARRGYDFATMLDAGWRHFDFCRKQGIGFAPNYRMHASRATPNIDIMPCPINRVTAIFLEHDAARTAIKFSRCIFISARFTKHL